MSGRELHEQLEVATEYRHWFPRMCEYGFTEGVDFNAVKNDRVRLEGDREVSRAIEDHQLTINMAKELCMIQRTERGKMFRQYLIQVEQAWNTPAAVMARALKLADRQILSLRQTNSELTVQNAIMAPKADYFDELVDRNLLTNFRDTAKQFGVKQNEFVSFLLERKYVYRGSGGKLMPYAQHVENGLFELKEQYNEKTDWKGTQTLITPKGRETFRLLVPGTRKAA